METGIIIAVISIIGQVILIFLQRKQTESQIKKTDVETSGILIDKAMSLNKQELENLKLLYSSLQDDYLAIKKERDELEKKLHDYLAEDKE